MQSGGGSQQLGGGIHGRSTVASGSASPSSSSSPVSTFDQQSHRQQLQQQQQLRQSLQQHFLRRPDANDSLLSYQAGNVGVSGGGGNFAAVSGSMQPRNFIDLGQQQHGSTSFPEQSHFRNQGFEQHPSIPMQQSYLQFGFPASHQKSALGIQSQQLMRPGMFGSFGKDQEMQLSNMKTEELGSMPASKKYAEHVVYNDKQPDLSQRSQLDDQTDAKLNQPTLLGQKISSPLLGQSQQQSMMNMPNNSISMAAQMQAMQTLGYDHRNIDLSNPATVNKISQLALHLQQRMIPHQKTGEYTSGNQSGSFIKQNVSSPHVGNENSARGPSSSDVSGQSGSSKTRPVTPSNLSLPSSSAAVNNLSLQQFLAYARDNSLPLRQPTGVPGATSMNPVSTNLSQGVDGSLSKNSANVGASQSPSQSIGPSNEVDAGNPSSASQGGPMTRAAGFTKQQLHVLKAQILAFRRLKKGDGTLPRELLQSIVPPPLDLQTISIPYGSKDKLARESRNDNEREIESTEKGKLDNAVNNPSEPASGDNKVSSMPVNLQTLNSSENIQRFVPPLSKEQLVTNVKLDMESETGNSTRTSGERGKEIVPPSNASDTGLVKSPIQARTSGQTKEAVVSNRKYHGPLFDFPVFTRKHDSLGPSLVNNSSNNLALAYDITDLFADGVDVIHKRKRQEKIENIDRVLAVNLERKRIKPDLVMRLQIELKKLQLAEYQARLRDEIDQQQQEIMAMPDRPYRKFVRLCERQRQELNRQVAANLKATRDKQLKSIFQWRKKLLEAHWSIRDARTARNRGVHKYHEKMLREFSKNHDDDRNKRMEALKNNDVERYREMLLEQQSNVPGEAAERYAVLSSFLSQTEDYLHKLGGKITAAKNLQEVEEAANAAATAARAQGLSEEEVRAAAACAREEVMIRNHFSEMNAPKDSSSVNKYYNLAHAVNERVFRQPSMLRTGTLRDYQLVGLQWMLSLYNNKLNGILADEMGLGKTVQVMALIAYLMEFKGNYGPHLIIVPNAVLVNWKSELHSWLPTASCIYYVGGKDQRSKLFFQEVLAMKFNVLVTTYEFVMYDRSKLSKIDWKYIIIDEAQRMKDRESVLARDLDRYRCQRRLLLTGTPLQNDLKELWSLLNLLLPEVFDNRKAFHDWFSQPFQKEGLGHSAENDWLETEKKVIIIHRLHQILEPFMLRRRLEDVEGALPPKVSIVLKCRMSAIQSAIYDWIKATGTLRVDPEEEQRRVERNPIYQAKTYKTLNNRCMELRKACNHPLLNYPYFGDLSKDFLVRSCGKMWVLDRILIKLQRTGHRVLLFSTMTKLLDIVEEYLVWRRLVFRRIDGMTSLEDRESAIVDFNGPNSDCFIFLLSIRAAGRGLNLQSADTVIIYDPDPNPKNEEQAVARAHRIGQTREVKVIYMEAVVDKISSHQKEDDFRRRGIVDSDDDYAGKDRYMGSIESLIRNNIQQYKIDMADEVINAGRFDQRTTHEERRMTLETLLHDEERYQETVHDVPSLQEVNRMIARSEEEVEIFDQMDEELDEWTDDMTRFDQVPDWLRPGTKEVNSAIANLSKKPYRNGLYGGNIGVDSTELPSERRRGRPKGKKPVYTEVEEEALEFSDEISEERNGYAVQEEVEADSEDEEFNNGEKDQSEEECPVSATGYEYQRALQRPRNGNIENEGGSTGSSSHSRKPIPLSVSSQKFGSLSALDCRSNPRSMKSGDDLEEGEIALSGDSIFEQQQSGSWIRERDEVEDEQVLQQPKIRRKRSIRPRPRQQTMEWNEEKSNEKSPLGRIDPSQLTFQAEYKYKSWAGDESAAKVLKIPKSDKAVKNKRSLPRKATVTAEGPVKSGRASCKPPDPPDEEYSIENLNRRGTNSQPKRGGGPKISDIIQRKCKSVISKLQRRIDHEGHQIVPLLTQLWKRFENSGHHNLIDLRKIHARLDGFEYTSVVDVISDVQVMLRTGMQHYSFSFEVRDEAKKVHDLFFDILYIAFPDMEFSEAKNSMSFFSNNTNTSQQHTVPSSSRRAPKDSGENNNSTAYSHPGDLIVCKKKRKDREKSAAVKSNHRMGIIAAGVGPTVGWANPVKRMRSDSGRRRPPSHYRE